MYIYEFMRKNEGRKNWDMMEIIKINCKDKKEAEIKKREYIETIKASLNKNIPFIELDKIKEIHKKKYADNVNKIKEYHQQYQLKNADKIRVYQKEYNTAYQFENADKIKEQYYIENAIRMNQRNNMET